MPSYDLEATFEHVEFADSMLRRIRGLMFKDIDEGTVLVHRWERVRDRTAHMIGARQPAHCYWLVDGEVVAHEWLPPWRGSSTHEADTLLQVIGESPIEVGDRVAL